MSNLTIVKKNVVYTSSIIISEYLEREHRLVYRLVKAYENELKKFGVLHFESSKPKTGRPLNFVYLNEEQYLFLIMNMRTKSNEIDKVMQLKIDISKEFVRMKKMLLNLSMQKANQEWLEVRKKGKVSRLKQTDVLKLFSEYAVNQGSNGYKKENQVYITFTKLENNSLFVIDKLIVKDLKKKKQSLRDLLNINQLDEIKQADEIILKALIDGMNKEMFYKDIYKLAKKRVETFVELKGKSVVPSIEFGYLEEGMSHVKKIG
jgi:phage regulator Rha-like protein